MNKKYLIIFTGENVTDLDISIINFNKSMDVVLIDAIESLGFNTKDEDDIEEVQNLLNELPIGIAELENNQPEHPDIHWYYELP